jgi:hypothetical protein
MPRLGRVEGTVTYELQLDGPEDGWRWMLVARPGARTLVVQSASTFPRGWEVLRATTWELPRWCEPFEDRLHAAASPEQVRAVLGAGSVREEFLYDHDDWPEPEEEPEWHPPWSACELYDIPEALVEATKELAADLAAKYRIALDVTMFDWLHAATSRGTHEHLGVGVLGWDAMRVVGPARFGGEQALLIGTVHVTEGDDLIGDLEGGGVSLRVVPWTGVEAAARAVIELEPGFELPRSFSTWRNP